MKMITSRFWSGLRDGSIKNALREQKNVLTMNELVSRARELEEEFSVQTESKKAESRSHQQQAPNEPPISQLMKKMDTLMTTISRTVKSSEVTPTETTQNTQQKPTIRCHKCHDEGHLSFGCRQGTEITCYRCKKKGHISRACRIHLKLGRISFEGRKGIKRSEGSPKLEEKKCQGQREEKCELVGASHVMKIRIGGKECDGLIDTGSMITTVGEEFYRKELNSLEIKPLSTLLEIEGAGGQCVPYLGMIEVGMEIPGSEQLDVPVLVVPATKFNSSVPVIVGTNVLKAITNAETILHLNAQIAKSIEAMDPEDDVTVYASEEVVIDPGASIVVEGYVTRKGEIH